MPVLHELAHRRVQFVHENIREYFHDVDDHLVRTVDKIGGPGQGRPDHRVQRRRRPHPRHHRAHRTRRDHPHAGVYNPPPEPSGITGTLTLDAQGDPNAVFIFQAASTLITASASTVTLTGGAQACNVFWQVGSSATLGTGSTFVGNILALTSITAPPG